MILKGLKLYSHRAKALALSLLIGMGPDQLLVTKLMLRLGVNSAIEIILLQSVASSDDTSSKANVRCEWTLTSANFKTFQVLKIAQTR